MGVGATKLKKFSVSSDRGETVGSKAARGLGAAKAPSGVQGRSPGGGQGAKPPENFGKITHFCHVFHDF